MIRRSGVAVPLVIATTVLLAIANPAAAANPQVNFTSSAGPMNLAAGAWLVTATGLVAGGGARECDLNKNASQTLDSATWNFSPSDLGRQFASFLLTAVTSDASSSTVEVDCNTDTAGVSISAIKLASSGTGTALKKTNDSAQTFSGTAYHTIASLNLGAGKWWIVGKTDLVDNSTSTENVVCRLLIKPDKDQTSQSMYYMGQAGDEGLAAVQIAHVFGSAGSAKLQCVDPKGHSVSANHVRLIAYKLGRLTRIPFGGSASTSGGATSTPALITTYRNASVSLGTSYSAVLTLSNIPPGSWVVSAKAVLKDNTATDVDCYLQASAASNSVSTSGAPAGGLTGLYLQAYFFSSGASSASVNCRTFTAGPSISFIRITALQAANA